MNTIYVSIIKLLILVISVVTLSYCSYNSGYNSAEVKYTKQLNDKLKQEQSKYLEIQHQLFQLQKEKENEIKIINSKHTAIVNGLRNRIERPIAIPPIQCTSTIDSSRTGSTGEQLFREDAEFLIGEALKAEVLKQSLLACRASQAVPIRNTP